MKRLLLMTAGIFAMLETSLNADAPSLPKNVSPVVATAEALKDGKSIELSIPKVQWSVVGEEKPKQEWPRFEVEVEEEILALQLAYDPATQLSERAQNRIVDMQGRKLSHEELAKRLATKTGVLVSVSGTMPEPFYLQFTKPETLIVILGYPHSPASKLLPQPKR